MTAATTPTTTVGDAFDAAQTALEHHLGTNTAAALMLKALDDAGLLIPDTPAELTLLANVLAADPDGIVSSVGRYLRAVALAITRDSA